MRTGTERDGLPEWEESCPFCPGNEEDLTEIQLEMAAQTDPGWQTRIVPNKFPALTTKEQGGQRYAKGIYLAMSGYGQHDVIIESPKHNRNIAEMSDQEIEIVVETYHKRYVDLMEKHGNMMAILFRNHGKRAGTSLIHPHSQVIVTGMVPRYIRFREDVAEDYFDEFGSCVYCDILEHEIKDRRRLVLENDRFLAFVPFAADVPFEMWIMPKTHRADFGSISDLEKEHFAMIFRDCLGKLFYELNDPDYNYVFNTAARYKAGEPQLHWFLQIQPRLTTRAGFEIGSGIRVNPSLPEDDAEFLRGESE